jgi:hypothetical protein
LTRRQVFTGIEGRNNNLIQGDINLAHGDLRGRYTSLYQTARIPIADLNGVCNTSRMLTLQALCSDMEASGRHLTPRAARDWWAKGLLPRPKRLPLGRGKGTKTFWINSDVRRQAVAVHDLLARHARTDIALLHLWLMGFPIDTRFVRAIFLALNARHLREIYEQAEKLPEDVIGDLAGKLARREVGRAAAPVEVHDAYSALAFEFLSVFYGRESELMIEGLAEQWEKVVPYLAEAGSQTGGLAVLHPTDETLALWAQQLGQFVSLPAQRAAIEASSDYELMRARRLIRFALEYFRRISNAVGPQRACDVFILHDLAGRLTPVLIAILRDDTVRSVVMTSLLDIVLKMPPQTEWPALVAAAVGREALQDCSTIH